MSCALCTTHHTYEHTSLPTHLLTYLGTYIPILTGGHTQFSSQVLQQQQQLPASLPPDPPNRPLIMTHPASSTSPDESSTNQIVPTSRPDYNAAPNNESQPRAKRIACVLCRKRKLRCDGARPKCATCNRLSHDCGYEEVRKKSGPKRGYVKLLEARLRSSRFSFMPNHPTNGFQNK